jgi:NAD(P)H-flavin reductase
MLATASNPRVAHPMTPVLGHVRQRWMETDDTFTVELDVEQPEPFSFQPGQFNMLYVFGVGEIPISISGNPDRPETLTHTTREVGIVTRAMRQLTVGDVLGVRGPFGSTWPMEAAEERDVVVIAGGIGLAPLRPVLYHLVAHRERYRRVVLLYGARTPEDILYQDEVREWSSYLDVEVHVTVDRATRRWHGNVGVITTLIPRAPFDPKNALAMICGPEIMMHFTVQELHRRGVRSDQIYVSMERNMQCALGLCGHCQYGPSFVCKDGPVYRFDEIEPLFSVREL